MILFLIGLLILVVGYFTYSKLIERIVGVDDTPTPAKTSYNGVDYVEIPHWKNMLIQLLNIAGIGPVVGVILGIKFGVICFLIIPIGNIIGGAVHDYLAGMMSIKNNGEELPSIIKSNLGKYAAVIFNIVTIIVLFQVVAIFINIPANLIVSKFSILGNFEYSLLAVICLIFLYYIIATLFPIDKIIGKVYPYIGAILIIGTLAIFAALMFATCKDTSILTESPKFLEYKFTAENNHPIIPLLFITISCGIISGFHATQAPIVSKTMSSQKQGRQVFYGMMVVEGIIAMIWAGAGLAIYNLVPELLTQAPTSVLIKLTQYFLGDVLGFITILAVITLAITTGDTALRALRLSCASILKVDQVKISKRLILITPLIIATIAILIWSAKYTDSFAVVWNYLIWGNQVLSAFTLMAASVWLFRRAKNGYVAFIPAIFMTFIVLSFILWTTPKLDAKLPWGFGLSLNTSYFIAGVLSFILALVVYMHAKKTKL